MLPLSPSMKSDEEGKMIEKRRDEVRGLRVDFLSTLPPEISLHCLSFIPNFSILYNISLCCSWYNTLVFDPIEWMKRIDADFPHLKDSCAFQVPQKLFAILKHISPTLVDDDFNDTDEREEASRDTPLITSRSEYPNWAKIYRRLDSFSIMVCKNPSNYFDASVEMKDFPLLRYFLSTPFLCNVERMRRVSSRFPDDFESVSVNDSEGILIPAISRYIVFEGKGNEKKGTGDSHDAMDLRRLTKYGNLISVCMNNQNVNESMGDLLESLPLSRLREFSLTSARSVENFPSLLFFARNMNSLRKMTLRDSNLEGSPSILKAVCQMKQLVDLRLTSCSLGRAFESLNVRELSNLEIFDLSDNNFVSLPSGIENLRKLEHFSVSSCTSLSSLPPSICELESLRYLNISRSAVTSLPSNFGNLRRLEKFIAFKCVLLGSLPSSFGELKRLNTVDLRSCGRIATLPECIGELTNIRVLNLRFCGSLASIPRSIGKLDSISELDVSTSRICHLPSSIGNLSRLTKLDLSRCAHLSSLPFSISNLKSLRILNVNGSDMDELPSGIQDCKKLSELFCNDCIALRSLPLDFGECQNLEILYLVNSGLESLPESFGSLKRLHFLSMGQCRSLESLPESFGYLRSLNELHCSSSSLKILPSTFGNLKSLKFIDLSNNVLKEIPECFVELESLDEIDLTDCKVMREMPAFLSRLSECSIFHSYSGSK